jgi:hypothetical protein
MSSISRDPKRKVSEPTEADFARGIAGSADLTRGTASFLVSLAANILLSKSRQRRKR